MGKLNQARWIGASTLAVMFIIGETALLNPKGNYEWFPFYSWSMFALVPDVERNYLVKVSRTEAPPVDFRNAGAHVRNPKHLEAYHLIQRWGRSVESKDLSRAEELRQAFEQRYLLPGIRYRLYARAEDPLTLWKEKTGKQQANATPEPLDSWRTVKSAPNLMERTP